MSADIALIASLIAMVSSLTSVIAFFIARKKDHEETVRWMQRVDDKIETHNNYATLFASVTSSITTLQQDVAYIKGKMN